MRALRRAPDPAPPLPGRRRGRADLPEAGAREAAGLDRGRARHLPLGPARGRALRHRARAGRLGGEPRRRRLPSLAVAPPRRRPAGRAAHRHRPAAGHGRSPTRSASPALVREVLAEMGYTGWPKTSGNRGIHVACRIEPNWEFPVVRRCALAFAREVERRLPELVTTAWWKEERGERVFIDYNQNARDRTIASAYSVRGRPDATVSAPVTWDELPGRRDRGLHARVDAGALRRARRRAGGDRRRRRATCACCSSGSSARRRQGVGEAPYPPNFPKMPGEPQRVQPSRKKKAEG